MYILSTGNRRQHALILSVILLLLGSLTACAGNDETSSAITEAADLVPIIAGQTADGTYYRGQPDAPVTLTEYSDFL
ncbi:MAG: hypothetical protein R3C44_10645 [Chloroflexota bacterium]